MTDYVRQLMDLATTRKMGWENSDCPVLRTTTIETTKAWQTALKYTKLTEAELYEKCELAIQAQARFRRDSRKSRRRNAQPKMLSAWLNAGRWEEEIESHAELKDKTQTKICTNCKTNETIGPHYSTCPACWDEKYGRNTRLLSNHMDNNGYKNKKKDKLIEILHNSRFYKMTKKEI